MEAEAVLPEAEVEAPHGEPVAEEGGEAEGFAPQEEVPAAPGSIPTEELPTDDEAIGASEPGETEGLDEQES